MTTTTSMLHGFTGNDLKKLRRALVLTDESFAKHMNLKAKFVRKAERLKDKEIPLDNEFRSLFENMCYSIPRMILIRFEHMNNIQKILQGLSVKLERAEKWMNREQRQEEEETSEDVEKEERILSATATDKRSVSPDDAED